MGPARAQEGDDPAAMLQAVGAQEAAAHRLVVTPHTAPSSPHGCPLCPANLCKVPPPLPRPVSQWHHSLAPAW